MFWSHARQRRHTSTRLGRESIVRAVGGVLVKSMGWRAWGTRRYEARVLQSRVAWVDMRRQLRLDKPSGQALLALMTLLTLAAGFCLFDGDELDHISVDLCQAFALFSTAVVVLVAARIQLLAADPRPGTYAASVRRLWTPRRSSPLSPSSVYAASRRAGTSGAGAPASGGDAGCLHAAPSVRENWRGREGAVH